MANLTDRLIPDPGDPGRLPSGVPFRIGVHAFMAAMGELKRGEFTRAQIISTLELDASATTDLDAIIAIVTALPDNQARENYRMELHDLLILMEEGYAYSTRAALRTRMGV